MGIQIKEHQLSPEVRKALKNSKNKSQFLRDALEFYVRKSENSNSIVQNDIQNDIREIKGLLIKLEKASDKRVFSSEEDKEKPISKKDNANLVESSIEEAIDASLEYI